MWSIYAHWGAQAWGFGQFLTIRSRREKPPERKPKLTAALSNAHRFMLDIVYTPDYRTYDFGPQHPFSPDRWQALEELMRFQGPDATWIVPVAVGDDDLLAVHTVPFLEAVHAASAGFPGTHGTSFGLGTQDVPVFFGMHEAAALVCGGTVEAARRIASGDAKRVLQLSGGLHHAMPNRAAGFCIYNDMALAINALLSEGLRVAYVDIDVHHGDGVQAAYYDNPDVLTISLHEDGRFLFPGTGFVRERGEGAGIGACINLPLMPGTGDDEWLMAFDRIVPGALAAFAPDVIVVEAGADAHFKDPLASMALTTHGFAGAVTRLVDLSDQYADGRLLAGLGGGYNFDSTLRQWFILGCLMGGIDLPEKLDTEWVERWGEQRSMALTPTVHDPQGPEISNPASKKAMEGNARMLEELERLLSA